MEQESKGDVISKESRPLSEGEKLLWNAVFTRRYVDEVYNPHFYFYVEQAGKSRKEALRDAFVRAIECACAVVNDFRKGKKDIGDKLGFKSEAHLMMRQALE